MTNDKQQTAVDKLVSLILKYDKSFLEFYNAEIIMAKETEKERMIEFACNVFDTNYGKDTSFKDTAKYLYQQTYGGGEQ